MKKMIFSWPQKPSYRDSSFQLLSGNISVVQRVYKCIYFFKITRKFRDEMHPRYAFLRGREFEMKGRWEYVPSFKSYLYWWWLAQQSQVATVLHIIELTLWRHQRKGTLLRNKQCHPRSAFFTLLQWHFLSALHRGQQKDKTRKKLLWVGVWI